MQELTLNDNITSIFFDIVQEETVEQQEGPVKPISRPDAEQYLSELVDEYDLAMPEVTRQEILGRARITNGFNPIKLQDGMYYSGSITYYTIAFKRDEYKPLAELSASSKVQ